jgi:hypothetical protein
MIFAAATISLLSLKLAVTPGTEPLALWNEDALTSIVAPLNVHWDG